MPISVDPSPRCGLIALLGRPNSGKSTLLNSLVGQKIAGVSKRPQTTRNNILGIVTEGHHQLLIKDTPGIHRVGGLTTLNRLMVREAFRVLENVHAVAYLVDVTLGFTEEDHEFLKRIIKATLAPIYLFLTKVDKIPKTRVRDILRQAKEMTSSYEKELPVEGISAKRADSLELFKNIMAHNLPKAAFLYPADDITDRPVKFIVSELIRETLFRKLGQELPYHSCVLLSSYESKPHLDVIYADIIVARHSQKGMIVGKNGAKIKEIGQDARLQIEKLVGKKVYLELQVKVELQWHDQKMAVTSHLGYI